MNKFMPIFAIVMILAVSGCVGGGSGITTDGSGNGLEITDFSSDLTDVYSGKTTRIMMTIENQGDVEVNMDKGLALLIGGYDWDIGTQTRVQELKKDLMAADPTREIPAGTSLFKWTLTAPDYPRGQSKTDQMIGRVYYDYETKAVGSVWAYPAGEAAAARDAKESLQTSTFQSTKGPVSLEVSVSPDPVEFETFNDYFTLYVKVSNVGGGKIYKPDIVTSSCSKFTEATSCINQGCYPIYDEVEGIVTFNSCSDCASIPVANCVAPYTTSGCVAGTACTGTIKAHDVAEDDLNKPTIIIDLSKSNGLVLQDSTCLNDIEVIGGITTVICDVTLSEIPTTKRSYPITVIADYGYYKDTELSLNVFGK
ncbi:MAG: hypothetical protein KJ697_02545 [Nanoarchaeota archaeon]|nr:hypothetical protein [Nanoarchaeota archaeon]